MWPTRVNGLQTSWKYPCGCRGYDHVILYRLVLMYHSGLSHCSNGTNRNIYEVSYYLDCMESFFWLAVEQLVHKIVLQASIMKATATGTVVLLVHLMVLYLCSSLKRFWSAWWYRPRWRNEIKISFATLKKGAQLLSRRSLSRFSSSFQGIFNENTNLITYCCWQDALH